MRIVWLLVALAALTGGCTATTSSRNIRTGGLVALIDVTSETPGQAVVGTNLVVGGANSNTYVVLEGGDRMYAEVAGDRREMNAIGSGKYEAKYAVSDGEFVVLLERDVDAPAAQNRGQLPPPFDITSHFGDAPKSRKDPITITWAPAHGGSEIEIQVRGDCIHNARYSVGGDPGSFTIGAGQLRAWKSKADQSCNVDVRISRTRTGTTDPAFGSESRFRLSQVRHTRFVSAP